MPEPTLPHLSKPLPARVFPGELDTLTIADAVGGVRVTIEADYLPVIDTTLQPTNGRVVISDLADPLRAAVASLGTRPAEVHVKLNGMTTDSTLMYPCRLPLARPAEQVLNRFFLSASLGRLQRLLPGQPLRLSWAHGDKSATDEPCRITAYWHEPTYNIMVSTITDTEPGRTSHYATLYITPERFLKRPEGEGWQLFRIDVICGRRHAQYELPPAGADLGEPAVLEFRNAFGLLEFLPVLGTTIREEHINYTAARIGGLFANIRSESEPTYKAATGPLPAGDVHVLRDLATASEVWLWEDSARGPRIAPLGLELKTDSDRHKSIEGELSWRTARRDEPLSVPAETNIFDDTFDQTFN